MYSKLWLLLNLRFKSRALEPFKSLKRTFPSLVVSLGFTFPLTTTISP